MSRTAGASDRGPASLSHRHRREGLDPTRANELLELAEKLAADAAALRAELDLEFKTSQLAAVVAEDWDLGEVVGVDQIFGGYSNLSFAVRTRTGAGERRYFVRKYGRSITEDEIRFEHALINHINGKGLHLAASVFRNKAGGTFVTRDEVHGGEPETRHFAVYEMLEGLDKYTWVKNRLTDDEFDSAGRVLAQFHAMAHDFDSGGLGASNRPSCSSCASCAPPSRATPSRREPAAASSTSTTWSGCRRSTWPCAAAPSRRPSCRACRTCRCTATTTPATSSGSTATRPCGLFDFDWSKLDYRIFDVAEGIVYFCSSWEGHDSGELWLDKSAIFLRAYQDEAARFATPAVVRRRACRPAAHGRERQPVRAQLGRQRLLRGRRRVERRRVPHVPQASGPVDGVHRGPSRRAVAPGGAAGRAVGPRPREGEGLIRMDSPKFLYATPGPPHARGVARGARGRRHPSRTIRRPARSSRDTAARSTPRPASCGSRPSLVERYRALAPPSFQHLGSDPPLRSHHPRRRSDRRHGLVGAQRRRSRHRRRTARHVGLNSPQSPI